MALAGPSGSERSERNLSKVRTYLCGLTTAGQSLPMEDGRPNITAIAEAAGVLRNVFYTNSGIKRLLAEFVGAGPPRESVVLSRVQRDADLKSRRILQLEQQLAHAKAEVEELRKRLLTAEQLLTRYNTIEEVIKTGKRVMP